jgi:hypothetical protein
MISNCLEADSWKIFLRIIQPIRPNSVWASQADGVLSHVYFWNSSFHLVGEFLNILIYSKLFPIFNLLLLRLIRLLNNKYLLPLSVIPPRRNLFKSLLTAFITWKRSENKLGI